MTLPVYTDALDTLARTIWGEARGEPWRGKVAVAHVVLNRVKKGGWWGADIEAVCKHAYQFSCWNSNDPNLAKLEHVTLEEDQDFRECLAAAAAAIWGVEPDPTEGATHYHAKTIKPRWANGHEPSATIGAHIFYSTVT